MKLVVLAAGKGSRFYPITKKIPKGLVPILGRPMLEYVLAPYMDHISEIIMVVNSDLGHLIKNHFTNEYKGKPITYIVQPNEGPKGTFSSLSLCKDHLSDNDVFCVSNCDDLLEPKQMKEALKSKKIGLGVTKSKMPWYYLGIKTDNGIVKGFERYSKENGEFITNDFANGFYILSKGVLDFKPVETRDGEHGLPQTIFENINSYEMETHQVDEWQAVNGPDDLENAELFVKKHFSGLN
ncbi:MAG: NTP transferase domain-containing protein [Rickettsiaceae bacterium]|nr:NTP transferase domain-containing protein [Rickettsiaceae bacterium]USN94512.1 MAG: NTP transferase domain-containing protein [Candidatus Nomurabacteria bacterium]